MRRFKEFLRRRLSLLLAAAIVISMIPAGIYKAEAAYSGTCGDNLTWVLTEDGTLTISGSGTMDDLSYSGYPWQETK